MLPDIIKSNRFAVIPGQSRLNLMEKPNSGFDLENIDTDQLQLIYDFGVKHCPNFENIMIDSTSTIDGAAVHMAKSIESNLNLSCSILNGHVYFGRQVPFKYDYGSIYLRPFFMIKNKKGFGRVLRLLATLDLKLKIFNLHDRLWDMANDYYEQLVLEEPKEYKPALTFHTKNVIPFIKRIDFANNVIKEHPFKASEVTQICKDFPQLALWVKQAYQVICSDFAWTNYWSMDINHCSDDDFIACVDRIVLLWSDDRHSDEGFTAEISAYMQNQYENNFFGGFYAIANANEENFFKVLDARIKALKPLIKLTSTYYEYNEYR